MTALQTTAQPTSSLLHRLTRLAGFLTVLLALSTLTTPAAEAETYHVGILGGIGGAVEGDPFDHTAIEAQFGYRRGLRDLVVVRVGQLELDASDQQFDVDGELTWLTLTSEYRLPEDFYVSGFFVGLGLYQRRNDFGLGDDEGIGATFGIDGEFAITEHWGAIVQLTGHWADLGADQFWTTALGGITFSF